MRSEDRAADRSESSAERQLRGQAIIADLNKLAAPRCSTCGAAICLHECVQSMAMGFLGSLLCAACIARGLKQDRATLLASTLDFVASKECWSMAWRHADQCESADRPCDFRGALPHDAATGNAQGAGDGGASQSSEEGSHDPAINADESWDAGDLACGDLLLQLRLRLKDLGSGRVIELISTDQASPEDLPSWCNLTGHKLESAKHPRYLIRAR